MAQDRRPTKRRILAIEAGAIPQRPGGPARWLRFGASLAFLLGLPATALAGRGDALSALEPGINVRAGPSTNAEVMLKIGPQDRVIELAAKGPWFFVELPDLRKRGWVHTTVVAPAGSPAALQAARQAEPAPSTPPVGARSLLETAPPPEPAPPPVAALPDPEPPPPAAAAPAPEPAPPAVATAPAGEEPVAVREFRDTVRVLNERAVSLAGIGLFTDVRSLGGGQIEVVATDAFANVPAAGRESFTNALFDQWRIAAVGLQPLALQIVDPQGQVVMRRP
jgi:hypothetical protein